MEKKEDEGDDLAPKPTQKENQTMMTEVDRFLTHKEVNLKETEIYRENLANVDDEGILLLWDHLDIETKFELWAGNYFYMMPFELRNHLW